MIEAQNLSKYYGSHLALDQLSFHVERGQVMGLLGLNGAGKTTCLRILSGYLIPSGGACSINGLDVFRSPMQIKASIGYLPENPPLYTELTVENYLLFVGRMRGLALSFSKEWERVASLLHIGDIRHSLIRHLSLGYRKRVGIAQALIASPSVLILDEPIAGLDPLQIIEMRKLIRSLAGQYTIILSSHILTEVSRTCDKVVIIHQAKCLAELHSSDLAENLEERFISLTSAKSSSRVKAAN